MEIEKERRNTETVALLIIVTMYRTVNKYREIAV